MYGKVWKWAIIYFVCMILGELVIRFRIVTMAYYDYLGSTPTITEAFLPHTSD